MKTLIPLLIVFILQPFSFCQNHIISEKIQGDNYIIIIELESSYQIINSGESAYIKLPTSGLGNEKVNINNIANEFFIGVPKNTEPRLKFTILEETTVNAIPYVSTNENKNDLTRSTLEKFENKGYLWIDGQYCLHIRIFPFNSSYTQHKTKVIKKAEIRLDFGSKLPPLKEVQVSAFISNRGFAEESSRVNWFVPESDSWINYNYSYLKLGTAADGIYKMTFEDLLGMGVPVNSVDPAKFKIFKKGTQVPIYVFGESDLQFNPGDYIEFFGERNYGGNHRELNNYGEPYNEYLDRYTDTTVYWLSWEGEEGQRVVLQNANASIPVQDTLVYYHELIHFERNVWFDFSMPDLVRREMPFWYENKTWHEGNISVGGRNSTFQVSDVYPDRPFYVYIKLQSYASNISQNAHLLAISVNNSQLQDSGYINKYQQKLLAGTYNSNLLTSGSNVLKLHSFQTAAFPNTCIFDWYEVEYPRTLKPYNDSLRFGFPYVSDAVLLRGIKISDVNDDSLTVWKNNGAEYKKYMLSKSGSYVYFTDSVSNKDRFVLITKNKTAKPKFYYKKQFKNLRNPQNQADYIAVTHKAFNSKAAEYISFISSAYNVNAQLVDVDDIYDEFSYGFFNPEAIKEFLKSTHGLWQAPLPKYVTLIGGASYDYHLNKAKFQSITPKYNYVPSFGASVSDNWFVAWDTTGAYIPQMKIGRIPVKSIHELDFYLNKHINYINNPMDDWNKRYMFFSGGNFNDPSQLTQLREVNNYVINNFVAPPPIGGNYKHFYKTSNPNTNFGPYTPEEIQNTINNGSVFISYLGHSGTQTWDNSITQPSQLKNNKNKNSLITDFGCSTARFAEPDITSFSQLFLLDPDGQAIAYIGNSSLGFLSTSLLAPKIFYRKMLVDSIYNISEALNLTKLEILQNYGSSGVYNLFALTNTLVGDAILSLPIPGKPNLVINNTAVSFIPENPGDNLDSLKFEIDYYNYGRVSPDTFHVVINNTYSDSISYAIQLAKVLPNYSDKISFSIPIRSKPGQHQLSIQLDAQGQIDELNENDNSLIFDYLVLSSAIRPLVPHLYENQLSDSVLFLNPASKNVSDSVIIEISNSPDFTGSISNVVTLGIFNSSIGIGAASNRQWMRYKMFNTSAWGNPISFFTGGGLAYSLQDSLSFTQSSIKNLKYSSAGLRFDTSVTNISLLSAGYYDGKTAIIAVNGQNLIPENTIGGHHICLFDTAGYQFLSYHLFNPWETPNFTDVYSAFIDSLSDSVFVMIAVADEGRINSAELRNKLKTLGSLYIDSLQFRGSWSIIGRKGAIPGTVPEAFTRPAQGRAEIDTTFFKRFNSGFMVTSEIGPVGLWDSLEVSQNLRSQTSIKYKPIVIKSDNTADTLDYITMNGSTADLKYINAKIYPKMKLIAEFDSDTDTVSPELSVLTVKYKSAPEIGINYQTVTVDKDSLFNGDSIKVSFSVMNSGETQADSCRVLLRLVKPNNSTDTLINSIHSIPPFGGVQLEYTYASTVSDGNGSFSFNMSADPENKIPELYDDNNIYKVNFYVRGDTATSVSQSDFVVKFDGREIFDGDFVSSTPQLEISLSYPSWFPVNDTSSVAIYFNGKKVYNSEFDDIKYDTIKREILFNLMKRLEDGEYLFRIFTKNKLGQIESQPSFEVDFNVMNAAAILDVYNWPNPFKQNTFFTFRLSQKADELRIKIFTIAGRLIREIAVPSSGLSADFNKIEWDGRDQDGDPVSNGVYLYKIIMKRGDEVKEVTQKLAVVR